MVEAEPACQQNNDQSVPGLLVHWRELKSVFQKTEESRPTGVRLQASRAQDGGWTTAALGHVISLFTG
jgi:hypothetical protein